MEDAGRDIDVGHFSNVLAYESLTDGRLDGYLALSEVGFVGIDDGISVAGTGGEIGDLDFTKESDGLALEERGVEDAGVLQHLLLETDAAEEFAVLSFGGVVLKVLAEIALLTGFDEFALHLRELDIDHFFDFCYEIVVAFLGHIFHVGSCLREFLRCEFTDKF